MSEKIKDFDFNFDSTVHQLSEKYQVWTNSKPAIGLLTLVEDMSFLLQVQRSDRLNNTSRWNDKLSIWKFDDMKLWLTNKVICTLDCRHKSHTQVVCRFGWHVYVYLSISLITAWGARQEGNNRKSDFSASLVPFAYRKSCKGLYIQKHHRNEM